MDGEAASIVHRLFTVIVQYGDINLTPTAVESAGNLSVAVSRSVQVEPAARVEHVSIIPRGNKTLSISFTVHRVFNNIAAAEDFALDHESTLPAQAVLKLGARSFPDAALTNIRLTQIGVTIPVEYQFTAPGNKA